MDKANLVAQVWLRAIAVQLHKGDGEGARRTLDRALQSLPRRKHIKVRCLLALCL